MDGADPYNGSSADNQLDEIRNDKSMAREEHFGWYDDYEAYLSRFPRGRFARAARARMAALSQFRAVVEIEAPKVVTGGSRWDFDTTFSETGGKAGYSVDGYGYLEDVHGDRWGHNGGGINRGTVTCPAGGRTIDEHWCTDTDGRFQNATAVFTWTGVDAGGHHFERVTRTKLAPLDAAAAKSRR